MSLQSRFLNLILILGLVSIFAVGCGDSRHDYYYSGSYTAADNGNLLFKFQQPLQAQGEDGQSMLPDGTESLRFDFFTSTSSSRESYLYTVTRPAAPEVLVEEVPSSVHSVVVTALDGANQPLAVAQTDFDVVVGDTIIITFPYWEYTGIFEANAANRGTEQNPLEFPGAEFDYQLDADAIGYSAYFYTTPVGVDVLDEVKFFAKEPVLGLSVDEDSGSLTFDPELYEGGSFSVMVTYTHSDGEYYEEELIFFVASQPEVGEFVVSAEILALWLEIPIVRQYTPTWLSVEADFFPFTLPFEGFTTTGEEPNLRYTAVYTVSSGESDVLDEVEFSLRDAESGITIDSSNGSLSFSPNEYFDGVEFYVVLTYTTADGVDCEEEILFVVSSMIME